ncbi:hypothetical protein [Streptomyces synnematoformans]|uniref:Uncharacterized protein n=1 Tax=Streptomyces synnematoformans TaxID=415721 RepID=A0ABN2XDV1_9ACTN
MPEPTARAALRISAATMAVLALGGCMTVSGTGRPGPADTGADRNGTEPDGGVGAHAAPAAAAGGDGGSAPRLPAA